MLKHRSFRRQNNYETQINIDDKPINLTFYNSWTIERVEQYVEKMFQLGLFDYYEKWE